MKDKPTFESEGIEPVYDLERGAMLNDEAAKRDPDFRSKMEQGRAEAAKVKRQRD
jgi:hypothetical protein